MRKVLFLLLIVALQGCYESRKIETLTSFERKYFFDTEIEAQLKKDTVYWKYQISTDRYASKGNYTQALLGWDEMYKRPRRPYDQQKADSLLALYTPVDASEEIIKAAKNTRLTIINEAHHNSSHRLFTKSLLQDLYDQGYRHLGLEALDNTSSKDIELNDRGYPIYTSGHYTKDPNFSLLIREAIKIGYRVFPYEENVNAKMKFREIEQAKNIQQEMDQYPNDKFLIHCGFDHALEGDYPGAWEKAMAERLKNSSNIDPLTINQTTYSSRGIEEMDHPLLKLFSPEKPIVLKDASGTVLPYKRRNSWMDMAVFHPKATTVDGKIGINNDQSFLDISELNLEFPVMIMVYETSDNVRTSVPIYISELYEFREKISIPIAQGSYSFVFVDAKDHAITFKDNL